MDKGRKIIYLELLRIIAIFFVVYNHTRSLGYGLYETLNDNSLTYFASMSLMLVCKCAVPVFFMVSGGVLLGREESLKDLYRKRIRHMAVIILLFVFLQYLRIVRINGWESFQISTYLIYLYAGHIIEPYWFLPSYLGYLAVLPFLRKLVKGMDKQDYIYLAALSLAFDVVKNLIYFFTGYMWNVSAVVLNQIIFYPLAGYYFVNVFTIKNRKKYVLSALGGLCCSVLAGNLLEVWHYRYKGSYSTTVISILTPIITICLFILIRALAEGLDSQKKAGKIITVLGGTAFGVYLIEDPIRNQIEPLCLYLNRFISPLISGLIFAALSTAASMLLIYLVNLFFRVCKIKFKI